MNRTITLTPSLIDGMAKGSLNDPHTPGLAIQKLSRGKKVWKYMRWVPGKQGFLRRTLGTYPAFTIGAAREWANELNAMIDAGADPRDIWQEQERRDTMTVNRAHALYMDAVREAASIHSCVRPGEPSTAERTLWPGDHCDDSGFSPAKGRRAGSGARSWLTSRSIDRFRCMRPLIIATRRRRRSAGRSPHRMCIRLRFITLRHPLSQHNQCSVPDMGY